MDSDRVFDLLQRQAERVRAIESALQQLLQKIDGEQPKDFHTVTEAAELMGRAPYTVREWCRLGRLNATKALSGRGIDGEWRISREEILRWQKEGLLPVDRPYRHVR